MSRGENTQRGTYMTYISYMLCMRIPIIETKIFTFFETKTRSKHNKSLKYNFVFT